MSTHVFPPHITHRTEHNNPESFLAVAAAILAALFIMIALSVAVAVAFGAVMGHFTPTPPSIQTPDRVDCSLGTLHSFDGFPKHARPAA